MKIAIVSNYFNHHQVDLCNSINKMCEEFKFIATSTMSDERIRLGWGNIKIPSYLINYYSDKEICNNIIEEYDVLIWGNAPYLLAKNRIEKGKLVFVYSERVFKKGLFYWKNLRIIPSIYRAFHGHDNCYLLAASAYAAWDYNFMRCFNNKCYRWGYFPATITYSDIEEIIQKKEKGLILWVGRFIDWKHPEVCIQLAKYLNEKRIDFHIRMIGNGPLLEKIQKMSISEKLDDKIEFTGALSPEEVREVMLKAGIFISSSDKNEGWGAVVNEAMNSGCTVFASKQIGSAPFLIEDNKNGFLYENVKDMFTGVRKVLQNIAIQERLGKLAYNTILTEWNAQNAAEKIIILSEALLEGKQCEIVEGVCSKIVG